MGFYPGSNQAVLQRPQFSLACDACKDSLVFLFLFGCFEIDFCSGWPGTCNVA